MQITTREATQSIAVSPEEKIAVEVLSIGERMKPATFARHLFYRGLYQYLKDRVAHAPVLEDQVYAEMMNLIGEDAKLSHIRVVVEMKRGLEKPRSAKEAAEEYKERQREQADLDEKARTTPVTAKEAAGAAKARRSSEKPPSGPENQRVPVTKMKLAPDKKKK